MISLIIGTYNGEKFIDKCMQAVLSQTIAKEKLEIIIVDDASTDHTVERLKEYEQKYPEQIVLILNEKNSRETLQKGRNIGMRYARGEYVMFLDQDDWYRQDAFEILHDLMERNPELDYIEYGFQEVNAEGQVTNIYGTDEDDKLYKFQLEDERIRDQLFEKHILPGATFVWTKIYKRSFLIEENIRHNDGAKSSGYCDGYFSGLATTYCKNFGKLWLPFYNYQVWDGSYSHNTKWNDLNQFERCNAGMFYLEECKSRPDIEEKSNVVEYNFLRTFLLKTFSRFLLTFQPIPYDIFAFMQNEIRKECPKCMENSIVKNDPNLMSLVNLLEYDWTPEFLEVLKENSTKGDDRRE